MATVLYLTVSPDLGRLTLSSAGHLPPVLAEPGTDPELVDCEPAPPIGAHIPARHVDVEHELRPGATVGCYTDGLVERRGETLTTGLERLRRAFAPGHPESVCANVMTDLIGARRVQDDTALLVFRRTP
jgi:serine phosphatase RsbU (regulator of sigma subunit)